MFGFSKEMRLLKSVEFRFVFSNSQKYVSKNAVVLCRGSRKDGPRLGLVVSKKTMASAVDRNRFKRRMREIFRYEAPHLPPRDWVVVARRGAVDASFLDLKKAFCDGVFRLSRRNHGH